MHKRIHRLIAVTAAATTSLALTGAASAQGATQQCPECALGAVASGRFINGAGVGVPGLTVMVAPTDVVPLSGQSATPPILGRATTGADGSWTVTLPAKLPGVVQDAVDENNGVLNLEATATGTGQGQTFVGAEFMAVAVGTSDGSPATSASAMQDHSTSAPPGLMVVDQLGGQESTTDPQPAESWATRAIDAGAKESDPVPASPWQSAAGVGGQDFNPDLVGGVDYSTVVPMDNWCNPWTWTTKQTSIAWTTVGAAHDYWDSHGWFEYSNEASSSIGAEVSQDGTNWSFSGWDEQSNTTGVSVSSSKLGPKVSEQFQIPIKYAKQYGTQTCQSGTTHEYRVIGQGWTTWPSTGRAWQYGSSVLYQDGQTAWQNSNPNWRVNEGPGVEWTVYQGNSMTVGVAASVFGIGIKAFSTYTTDHRQYYETLTGTSRLHHMWGAQGDIVGGSNPGQLDAY